MGGKEDELSCIIDDATNYLIWAQTPIHEPDFNRAKARYRNDGPDWEDEWSPTQRCLEMIGWVRAFDMKLFLFRSSLSSLD